MDIRKYASYFHDGSIIGIIYKNDILEILMESSELLPEWNLEHIALTKDQTISGILKLEGIRSILINNYPTTLLNRGSEDGEILRFRLGENRVDLFIKWMNFPPNAEKDSLEHIIIEANKIHWNNIPNLLES